MPKPTKHHRRKETLADLTELMQTALIHCTSRGVLPDEFGDESDKRWPLATRDALEAHGLIHMSKNRKGRDLWKATDEGRGVVAAHSPRLLMPSARPRRVDEEGSCYTHLPAFAMRQEPEAA